MYRLTWSRIWYKYILSLVCGTWYLSLYKMVLILDIKNHTNISMWLVAFMTSAVMLHSLIGRSNDLFHVVCSFSFPWYWHIWFLQMVSQTLLFGGSLVSLVNAHWCKDDSVYTSSVGSGLWLSGLGIRQVMGWLPTLTGRWCVEKALKLPGKFCVLRIITREF